jgi:hypothetical protein
MEGTERGNQSQAEEHTRGRESNLRSPALPQEIPKRIIDPLERRV